MIKAHFSGRLVSSGISDDVVITSVHSEKTRLKKLVIISIIIIIIIIFIMNKSQQTISSRQKLIAATKARKVMVDFKFDALYR